MNSEGGRRNVFSRVFRFYLDGFRNMGSVGKKLWIIILVKLAVMFLVFKLIFFPNLLNRDYDNDADRADAVRSSMLDERRH